MKKIISTLALAALLLCVATSCNKEKYDNLTATITGTVIDMDSGEPIGNAQMTLSPGGLNSYTGNDGFFQFNDVEAQQYTLQAQKSGYQANRKTINAKAGETVNVSMTLQKEQ